MRWSVALGLIAGLTAAGCGHHRSSCREPSPGHAAIMGTAPIVASTPKPKPNQVLTEPTAPPSRQMESTFEGRPTGNTYGHAADYTWLIGRLQQVSTPTDQWKIRYAPIDEEDQWGGSMVLAPDARLSKYRDGDIVYVEGQIIAPRPSLYVSGPLYRVRTIKPFGQRLTEVDAAQVLE